MITSEWVVITPGKEGPKVAAQLLLQLATSPADVRTTSGGTEFRVPPYLAELYNPTPAPPPKRRRTVKKEEDENGD